MKTRAVYPLIVGAIAFVTIGLRTSPILIPATTCTNQFIRSIAAATGVGTCATVGSSDLASSLSLTTPNVNVATGTSLALGGATIGSNALAVTGTANISGNAIGQASITASAITSGTQISAYNNNTNAQLFGGTGRNGIFGPAASGILIASDWVFSFGSSASGNPDVFGLADTFLKRSAAATLQHGAADAAAPVAQTETVQSVVAGTSNTAGANWTFAGSKGTGTGAGGSLIFQVAPAGSTGTAQNALATALTIDSTKLATFAAGVTTTSINKMAVTAPATSSTLAVADGKTLTASNTLTFSGTDGSILTTLSSTSVGQGQYLGTATNDNATAGNVGEYVAAGSLANPATVTITIAAPAVITWTAHGIPVPTTSIKAATAVLFTTTGALPTGITASTVYYAVPIDANTFNIATTITNAMAGTFITTSGSQSGTQTGSFGVSLTSATVTDVVALGLTAGSWDVACISYYGAAAITAVVNMATNISPTAATQSRASGGGNFASVQLSSAGTVIANNEFFAIPTLPSRIQLSGTTTEFCNVNSTFNTSTMQARAFMRASRVR